MRIYAGSPAPEVTAVQLNQALAKSGKVDSCRLSIEKVARQPKGICFIEMPIEPEAQKAVAGPDGALPGGKPITVNEAKLKTDAAGTVATSK